MIVLPSKRLPQYFLQRRIVAKVEQPMALVAALETRLDASRYIGETYLTTFVVEINAEN